MPRNANIYRHRVTVPVRDMHAEGSPVVFHVLIYGMTKQEATDGGLIAPVAKTLLRNGFNPARYCAWGKDVR